MNWRKLARVLICGLALDCSALPAFADFTATQGSGITIASTVVSTKHYQDLVICDPTAGQAQCAGVNSSGQVAIQAPPSLPLPSGAATQTTLASTLAVQGTTTDAPCTVPTSATACTLAALLKAVANALNTATVTYPTVLGINFSGGGSSATASAIKSTGGQMLKVYCYNPNASVVYFQTFNTVSGSVTPGSTAPIGFYGIPPASAGGYSTPVGDNYTTAMSAAVTTTYNGGTQPTTAVPCTVSYN